MTKVFCKSRYWTKTFNMREIPRKHDILEFEGEFWKVRSVVWGPLDEDLEETSWTVVVYVELEDRDANV